MVPIFPWCPCELTASFKAIDTPLSKATVRMRPLSFGSLHANQISLQSHANDRLLTFTLCHYYSVKSPTTGFQHINSWIKGGTSMHPLSIPV